MTMSKNYVSPCSRADIRSYAMKVREALGFRNSDFIHAPKLFDALSVAFDAAGLNFDYKVFPDEDKIFENKE